MFDKDASVYDGTISKMFHDRAVRRIAMGTILHLIQDSFSLSHVERSVLDSGKSRYCRGPIKRFHAYANQDTEKHAEQDKWPENLPETAPGGNDVCDPVMAGAQLLKYFGQNNNQGADWKTVESFLVDNIFKLTDPEILSNAGQDFLP
ncbi:MAG: hypothetical protein HQ494_00775 [Rhodospirillales bacterium]|nr:hypothetical protein [Rhodospirillales bacterium]